MKRVVSIMLAAMMLVLGGCGNNNTGSSGESPSAGQDTDSSVEENGSSALKDGNMTELLVVFPGSNAAPASLQKVQDELNSIITETMDATVKLQIQEWGTYTDQTNLMLSSGEKMDIFFSFSGTKDYAAKGQLLPITGLLDTYGVGIKEHMQSYTDACYVSGELYGVPTFHEYAQQAGLVCRKDILDETGLDAASIKTWEDVENLLIKVKELYPSLNPLVISDLNRGPLQNYLLGTFDIVETMLGVGIYAEGNDTDVQILNIYDTDEFKELAERAYDWNNKGYFIKDATTVTETRQDLIRAGNSFGYIGLIHPGTKTQETQNSGKEIETIPITKSITPTASVIGAQWTIPAACESPEKALAFLNLLYSDEKVQNLFRYGIEGEDYIVKDEEKGIAGYPEGINAETVGWGNEVWLTGNAAIGYAWETDPENVWETYLTFNESAIKSPLYGFVFDSSNVRNEVTAITNVMSKYRGVIEAGYAEPASTLEKFIAELDAAGMQKVITDMQEQVDNWSAEK